jgi:acetate kinase
MLRNMRNRPRPESLSNNPLMTVNVGSSSVKLAVYRTTPDGVECLSATQVERDDQRAAQVLRSLQGANTPFSAVGHRIVHGGPRFSHACSVDDAVLAELTETQALAPLHNPPALHWLRQAALVWPQATQVVAFDTALFADMPQVAKAYALPASLTEAYPIRRYGFHGLAHTAMWQAYQTSAPTAAAHARVISLQLGSGCSMAALRGGKAVDTTMGFSPLEGLMMATRCGDIDAGLIFYLLEHTQLSAPQLEHVLQHDAGLAGVSQTSGNMQEILAAHTTAADRARDLFCYRIQKYVGAFVAVLGGIDAILFGGGIGEHAAEIRQQIVAGAAWCGARLSDTSPAPPAPGAIFPLHAADSSVEVYVVGVDESRVIATETVTCLSRSGNPA